MPAPVLPVLMYHSVSTVDGPLRPLAVPPALLAGQLAALTGAGYELLGLTAALDRLAGDPEAPVVALTFDDGFLDFATAALDVLAGAGAACTLYLAVGHLGQPAVWLGRRSGDYSRLLTWPEAAALSSSTVEIGNHGLVHEPLDILPARVLAGQVRVARDRLEQWIQAPVTSFAYPHGYHTARTRAVVAAAGYRTACEVGYRRYRLDGDRLAIPRLQPTPDLSGAALLDLVRHGGPRLGPAIKDLARPAWRMTRLVAHDTLGLRLT